MKTCSILLAVAALAASASLGHAALVYGLTSNNRLVSFNDNAPGTLLSDVSISGATGLIDIDVYPVNGLLYAMTASGATYTINPATGATTLRFTPITPPTGFAVRDFDFNPAADRIRISGNTATDANHNFRMVPDVVTGAAPPAAGTLLDDNTYSITAMPTSTLNIVGNAYTNNFDGTAATTLYSLDTDTNRLLVHPAAGTPTFSAIDVVGTLSTAIGSNVGFDIIGNTSAFVSDGNQFYSLNLTNASMTLIGTIGTASGGGTILSIAAVPEPGYTCLSLMGVALIGLRRRRSLKAIS